MVKMHKAMVMATKGLGLRIIIRSSRASWGNAGSEAMVAGGGGCELCRFVGSC
jgi:hypothetical protein